VTGRPASVDHDVDALHALAAWAEALAMAKDLKARLLEPNPGDVRAAVARLEQQVRAAAGMPVGRADTTEPFYAALRGVLKDFAETTQDLGLVADARARTAQGVLSLFRRSDLPPGSVFDV
jgi:hypothetical protein